MDTHKCQLSKGLSMVESVLSINIVYARVSTPATLIMGFPRDLVSLNIDARKYIRKPARKRTSPTS